MYIARRTSYNAPVDEKIDALNFLENFMRITVTIVVDVPDEPERDRVLDALNESVDEINESIDGSVEIKSVDENQ